MSDVDPYDLPEPDWVFGYGSLIWNPGFAYQEAVLARVHGYRRSFCIRSARYRGTPEAPGVVLGLAQGGSCIGMAFRLDPAHRAAAVKSLYEREMPGQLYVPRMIDAHRLIDAHRMTDTRRLIDAHRTIDTCRTIDTQQTIDTHRMIEAPWPTKAAPVRALTFVANTAHPAFGLLPETEVLRRLLICAGERGPNLEYAQRTHDSLRAHGVRCTVLERLMQRLGQTLSSSSSRRPPTVASPASPSIPAMNREAQ
jgi:cation transport protein ChaC